MSRSLKVRHIIHRSNQLDLILVFAELSSLKTSQAVLLAELTSLEHVNDQLTYAHNNGAYDPSTTKILQLSTNPDSLEMGTRLTTLEGLREENRQLLDRLQRKSARGGEDVVPSISFENLQREKDLVDKMLEKKEILETRLVKVSQASSRSLFRSLMTATTGLDDQSGRSEESDHVASRISNRFPSLRSRQALLTLRAKSRIRPSFLQFGE